MARWGSRPFTVVASLGPLWVEWGHSKVVVSWLLWFHVWVRSAPDFAQRAENGGLDPSWAFAVFGAPRFSVQEPLNTSSKGPWDLWTENQGAPKTRNPTTTEPTPIFS